MLPLSLDTNSIKLFVHSILQKILRFLNHNQHTLDNQFDFKLKIRWILEKYVKTIRSHQQLYLYHFSFHRNAIKLRETII